MLHTISSLIHTNYYLSKKIQIREIYLVLLIKLFIGIYILFFIVSSITALSVLHYLLVGGSFHMSFPCVKDLSIIQIFNILLKSILCQNY